MSYLLYTVMYGDHCGNTGGLVSSLVEAGLWRESGIIVPPFETGNFLFGTVSGDFAF